MRTWRLGPCLLPLLLLGCATPPLASFADLDFRVRGKIGARGDGEGFSASFDWRQAGDRYDIALRGPLGQGQVRLLGNSETISVTDASGAVFDGRRPDAFMQSALGWHLPVLTLRHWVRGRYDPSSPATQRSYDEDGNLAAFQQHGWTVRLSRWQALDGNVVPGKIVADRPAQRITVVCKEWWFD